MRQPQSTYQTQLDTIVFATEGLAPQIHKFRNGQAMVATGEINGASDAPEQYNQFFGQHNENPFYRYGKFLGRCHRYNHPRGLHAIGTKEVFSDGPYPALQNQVTQFSAFESSNTPSVQSLQGGQGVEEVIRRIPYGYGLPAAYYPSSGGAPFPGEFNVPPGPVAVSAPMGTAARTRNGTSLENYYDFNLATSAFTLSSGLVPPPQIDASNMFPGQTAYRSSVDPVSYSNPGATCPGTSVFGPEAQAAAPRMNTVTPCVVCCNDRGGAFVGAAACAIPAPGPTPNINDNVNDTRPLSTASTCPPRDAENACHRSPQKAHAPRVLGYRRTRRSTPTPRGASLSRAKTAKPSPVQYEKDTNTLAARLLNEGANPVAVGVLRMQVFNNGVTEGALMAKFIHREQPTNHSSVKRKYRLLLEHSSAGYCCLLCPQDRPAKYKTPQDSLRHLRKDHFGLALICLCGW